MTDEHPTPPEPTDASGLPFVAPCRELSLDAPLRWLACGWWDFRQALIPSLSLGLMLTLLSATIAWATWAYGTLALHLGLATGFVFVGPLLAVGFYAIRYPWLCHRLGRVRGDPSSDRARQLACLPRDHRRQSLGAARNLLTPTKTPCQLYPATQ